MLIHSVKFIVSSSILLALFILLRFKERIALAAGVEHMTFFRLGRLNPFHRPILHPIEIYVWKASDLPSGPVLKPNDVFLECHLGQNEPSRSRVHNNAGQGCVFKESFQLNVDENDPTELFTILIRDQSLLTSSTLCKLQMKSADLLQIEAQTGGQGADFTYSPNFFQELKLSPRGKIWIRVAPIEDEKLPLMSNGFDLSGLC